MCYNQGIETLNGKLIMGYYEYSQKIALDGCRAHDAEHAEAQAQEGAVAQYKREQSQ